MFADLFLFPEKRKEKEVRETVCCVRAHHLPFGISPQIKRKYKQSENVNIATFSTNNRIPRVVREKKRRARKEKKKRFESQSKTREREIQKYGHKKENQVCESRTRDPDMVAHDSAAAPFPFKTRSIYVL